MDKYYVDKDSGYRYKFLQDKFAESFEKQLKESNIPKHKFIEKLSAHPNMPLGTEAIRKHISKATTPKNISDVFAYGVVLENDPRAFLVVSETEKEYETQLREVLEHRDYPAICVAATKANLMKIFSEYAASDSFNKVEDNEDVLVYYRKKIDMVEAMVLRIFDRPKLTKVLLDIVKELKSFICSAEIPGIPEAWFEINPNLRFYAAGFEILEENPQLYDEMKNGKTTFRLDYLPESNEWAERLRYFAELDTYFHKKRMESEEQNYHYNEVDFYEKELLDAINKYFETTVKEVLKSGL